MKANAETALRRRYSEPDVRTLRKYYRWYDRFCCPETIVDRIARRRAFTQRDREREGMREVRGKRTMQEATSVALWGFFMWLGLTALYDQDSDLIVLYIFVASTAAAVALGRLW
jgi:hypothetical protein